MRQGELISTIAERTAFGKGQVGKMLDSFIAVCREELLAEGDVYLNNLGRLSIATRQAGNGRNPATGEPIKIAATRRVTFSTAKGMKEQLNPKPVAARRRA
jgi:DNA-binding protein HU-beta